MSEGRRGRWGERGCSVKLRSFHLQAEVSDLDSAEHLSGGHSVVSDSHSVDDAPGHEDAATSGAELDGDGMAQEDSRDTAELEASAEQGSFERHQDPLSYPPQSLELTTRQDILEPRNSPPDLDTRITEAQAPTFPVHLEILSSSQSTFEDGVRWTTPRLPGPTMQYPPIASSPATVTRNEHSHPTSTPEPPRHTEASFLPDASLTDSQFLHVHPFFPGAPSPALSPIKLMHSTASSPAR